MSLIYRFPLPGPFAFTGRVRMPRIKGLSWLVKIPAWVVIGPVILGAWMMMLCAWVVLAFVAAVVGLAGFLLSLAR